MEIIDWGCGQGIGSVCVIDFLKDRELTRWLKRVTLIEPSAEALERAQANVARATGYNRDVKRLEKVYKRRFTMDTHDLKLSTIQSFKP